MNFSFLEVLTGEYTDCQMDFLENCKTDESDEFYDKYIQPLFSQDKKAAGALETDFHSAIGAQREKSFKDGFKACMQILLECASNKAVEL